LYELSLVFLLFQDLESARNMMVLLDPSLGVPLPEKSYGEDCSLTPTTLWVRVLAFFQTTFNNICKRTERFRHFCPRSHFGVVWEGDDSERLLVLLGRKVPLSNIPSVKRSHFTRF
jgi:hypothetical protein